MWRNALMLMLCLAGSACASGAGAQTLQLERIPSADEILADFVRYHEATGTPEQARMNRPQLRMVFFYPERFGPSLVEELVQGLTELAPTAESMSVRLAALTWLMAAGDTGQMGTGLRRTDVVRRLRTIIRADPSMRTAIIDRLWSQADQSGAAALLVEIAEADRPDDRGEEFPDAYRAVNALAKMGEVGRTELQGLLERGRVRNYRARGLLEYLAERSFVPPDAD